MKAKAKAKGDDARELNSNAEPTTISKGEKRFRSDSTQLFASRGNERFEVGKLRLRSGGNKRAETQKISPSGERLFFYLFSFLQCPNKDKANGWRVNEEVDDREKKVKNG